MLLETKERKEEMAEVCERPVSLLASMLTGHMVVFPKIGMLLTAGGLLSVVVVTAVVGLAWFIVWTITHPKKRDHAVLLTPYTLGLAAEEVSFPCRGETHQVRGLYIPAAGASSTILVCPGYRRSLADVLITCKHLWEAGHTVLAFEFYGHGLPVGSLLTLGYRELEDVFGAVAYAWRRNPTTRVGAIGYSMGAATTILAAARTTQIEALVADSSFATQWSAVERAVRRTLRVPLPGWFMAVLFQVTDWLLWVRAGYRFSQVEPLREIRQIAPRPLLLIHGLGDTIVDPADARRLYEAAAEPKEVWLIPGCEHLRGYWLHPAAYVAKVIAFFEPLKAPCTLETPALPHVSRGSTALPLVLDASARSVVASASIQVAAPFPRSGGSHAPRRRLQEALRVRRWRRCLQLRYAHRSAHPAQAFGLACGHLLARARWLIVALWLVALTISLPIARDLPTLLHNSGYVIAGSESQQVERILTHTLHQPTSQLVVVLQSATTPVSAPSYQQEVAEVLVQMRRFPTVMSVAQGGVGRDGRTTLLSVGFTTDQDTLVQQLPALRTLLARWANHPARALLTGDAASTSELQVETQTDTEQAERLAFPVILLVLLLVFGSVVAGLMPLVLAAVTIPVTLALIAIVAGRVDTNIFVVNVASMIGLGLSIDYSLLIVSRFREELARGCGVRDAVGVTVATAGESVLCSGLVVMVGFSGLLLVGIPVMASFALGGILVAATAVLAALTLLPALLSILGPRVNAWRLARIMCLFQMPGWLRLPRRRTCFWRTWAMIVMRRPVVMMVVVTSILLGLGWPALSLSPGLPGASALPPASQARQALSVLDVQFPEATLSPILVIAQTSDGSNVLTGSMLTRLQAFSARIAVLPHVSKVTSLFSIPQGSGASTLTTQRLLALYRSGAYQRVQGLAQLVQATTRGDITLITLRPDTPVHSQDLILALRALNRQPGTGLRILVGGAQAQTLDFDQDLYGHAVWAFLFILLTTAVLLLLLFQSLVLPLKAVLMNMLSVSVAYGALVWCFQQGHLHTLLHFTPDGTIDRFVPVLLFCLLFGVSMDYEVFLLARMAEAWRELGENQAAVASGLERTGGIITQAALLFLIVSLAFLTTPLVVTKELGLGITVALLVDATLIRCVLVPATMQVLGRWNWWFPVRRNTSLSGTARAVCVRYRRVGGRVRITGEHAVTFLWGRGWAVGSQ